MHIPYMSIYYTYYQHIPGKLGWTRNIAGYVLDMTAGPIGDERDIPFFTANLRIEEFFRAVAFESTKSRHFSTEVFISIY